jgi:hypothetical protein
MQKPAGTKAKWHESAALMAVFAFAAIIALRCATAGDETTTLSVDTFKKSKNEKIQQGNWEWWTLRDYVCNRRDSDIVFMGSSQMACALASAEMADRAYPIDLVAHRNSEFAESKIKATGGTRSSTCCLALGGAMISDQYLIARSLFNEENKPQLVVLGINPRDFMDNTLGTISSTEVFRLLSPHVSLGDLTPLAYSDITSWFGWQVKRISAPGVTALNTLAANALNLADNILPREDTSILYPDEGIDLEHLMKLAATNDSVGNAAKAKLANLKNPDFLKPDPDPSSIGPRKCWLGKPDGMFADNTGEYVKRYKNPNPPMYASQKVFFTNLLAYFKQQNIPVLVVGMPSLWPNRDLLPPTFWTEFKQTVVGDCTRYGAEWMDLSELDDRFTSADYLDLVHLNSMGGSKLIEDVVGRIDQTPRLAATLKDRNIAGKSAPDKSL